MSNIQELLNFLRREGTNKPLQQVLEQAVKLRQEAKPGREPRARKPKRQDKRITRKKFYEWRKEHADELREYNSGLKQMYFHLRREVKRRGKLNPGSSWEWTLTMGEWVTMWLSCPAILVGINTYRPAWKMRGRDSSKDVQLKRADVTKGFEINNLEVWYQHKRIYPK